MKLVYSNKGRFFDSFFKDDLLYLIGLKKDALLIDFKTSTSTILFADKSYVYSYCSNLILMDGVVYSLTQQGVQEQINNIDSDFVIYFNRKNYLKCWRLEKLLIKSVMIQNGLAVWSNIDRISSPCYSSRTKLFSNGYSNTFFYKLNLDTGLPIWTYSVKEIGRKDFRGTLRDGNFYSTLKVINDIVIVPIAYGRLIGVDYLTGETKWVVDSRVIHSHLSYIEDGLVTYFAPNFGLIIIDISTGNIKREERLSYKDYPSVMFDCDGVRYKDRLFTVDKGKYFIYILNFYTLEIIDQIHIKRTKRRGLILDALRVYDSRIIIKEVLGNGYHWVHVIEYDNTPLAKPEVVKKNFVSRLFERL